jgi:Telomerase activating protein Est1/Est1 DNA/RNA binding domain
VERKLWRFAFYLPIGEFRSRIASPSTADQLKSKTLAAYLKFLEDGVSYYQTLVSHLTSALGKEKALSISSYTENDEATATATGTVGAESSLQTSLRTSLARCYICIGDLRRYSAAATGSISNLTTTAAAAAAENDNRDIKKEKGDDAPPSPQTSLYSSSRQAYASAVGVDPTFGNAYNQLAVLDETEGDPLAAAFFYLRAQCALIPFPLGHQNVALLLGAAVTAENTADAASKNAATGVAAKKSRKDYYSTMNNKKNTQQHQRGAMPTPLLEKEIISKYLALCGCLYEKIDVDATPLRLSTAGAFLNELLNRIKQQTGSGGVAKCARVVAQEVHSMPTSVQAAVEHRPVSLLLLITTVPLLLIQIFEESLDSNRITNNATSTSSTLTASAAARGYSISYLLDITTRFLLTASKLRLGTKGPVGDAALICPVFAPISVVLRWMVMRGAQPALITASGLFSLETKTKIEEDEEFDEGGAAVLTAMEEDNVIPSSVSVSSTVYNVERTVSGLNASRISFWKACAVLCGVLPSTGITNLELARGEEKKEKETLLSEDYLLTGFTPLLKRFAYTTGEEEKEIAEDPVAARALAAALSSSISSNNNHYQWSDSDPGKPGELRGRRIWQDLQTLASQATTWLLKAEKKIKNNRGSGATGSDEIRELKEAVNEFIEALAASLWPGTTATDKKLSAPKTVTEGAETAATAAAEEDQKEEDEEEIVFAPLSGARRSNSAALLNTSAGNSGRNTPAPSPLLLPEAAAASPYSEKAKKVEAAGQARVGIDFKNNSTVGGDGAADITLDVDEDPQAAMERTGYAMAATVLSSDDAEVNFEQQQEHRISLPPPLPPSSGLLGPLMFGSGDVVGGGSGSKSGSGSGDARKLPGGGSLLMSSWQQPQMQQLQLPGGGIAYSSVGISAPPPFPSSALLGGAVAHQPQEPAEGLRAVLFGGNNLQQQQQQQQPQQPSGGLWG